MAWRTMDVQQHVEFVVAAKREEQPFGALCREFGISGPTGYLWLHRYTQDGLKGISERSRRPALSPRRTAIDLEQRVMAVRRRYPDWGARKLREILAREHIALTRSTIHRILRRHGLVKECDQHPPALQRFEREQANQLWQMDFKGPRGWPQPVGPPCRCGTITAATCWCWRPTAARQSCLCESNWSTPFAAMACRKRC
jgi:transposase